MFEAYYTVRTSSVVLASLVAGEDVKGRPRLYFMERISPSFLVSTTGGAISAACFSVTRQ